MKLMRKVGHSAFSPYAGQKKRFSLQSTHQEYYFHITIGKSRNVQDTVSNVAVGYVSTVSCYFEKTVCTSENPQCHSYRLRIHMQIAYQKNGKKKRRSLYIFIIKPMPAALQDLNSVKYVSFQQT